MKGIKIMANQKIVFMITWKHKLTDFSFPLSIDDKINIYYEQVYGWQLNIADELVNGRNGIPNSDFACLQILLSYFEMISKYRSGFARDGRSKFHFREGIRVVYPNIFSAHSNTDSLLDKLYESARCGLYHIGITKPKFIVYSGSEAIRYYQTIDTIAINTHVLTKDLKKNLAQYKNELLKGSNTNLRSNFELRFDYDHS